LQFTRPLVLLQALVAIVLLIYCANLSGCFSPGIPRVSTSLQFAAHWERGARG
jgi:hypothetical protein